MASGNREYRESPLYISQLESEIERKRVELDNLYLQVGKNIMEATEQEGIKINHIVDQIIELQRKLAAAKNERLCSHCGQLNDETSTFCKNCGIRLEDHHNNKGI